MICPRCNKREAVRQYSYGYPAGSYCNPCAYEVFTDHAGLVKLDNGVIVEGGEQGDVTTTAEFELGGWDAIDGEPDVPSY